MSIYGNPVMLGGGGGGGVDRTLQNSRIINTVYTKEGYIGGFEYSSSFWQPYSSSGNALDVDWSQPWELNLKFISTYVDSNRECLYGSSTSNDYFHVPITAEYQQNGDWWFGFSLDGSSWGASALISLSEIPITANGEYSLNLVYNGSTVVITLSNESNTVTRTVTLGGTLYHNSNYTIAFGNIAQADRLKARYTYFDPDDCYIKSKGAMVWGSNSSQ